MKLFELLFCVNRKIDETLTRIEASINSLKGAITTMGGSINDQLAAVKAKVEENEATIKAQNTKIDGLITVTNNIFAQLGNVPNVTSEQQAAFDGIIATAQAGIDEATAEGVKIDATVAADTPPAE